MSPLPVVIEVKEQELKRQRGVVMGALVLRVGTDSLPQEPRAEPVAMVLAALMEASLAVLEGQSRQSAVALERNFMALLIQRGEGDKLEVHAFALAHKGNPARPLASWAVHGRHWVQALMNGADRVMRGCIYHEWQGEDMDIMISLAIAAKQWLDENKAGATE